MSAHATGYVGGVDRLDRRRDERLKLFGLLPRPLPSTFRLRAQRGAVDRDFSNVADRVDLASVRDRVVSGSVPVGFSIAWKQASGRQVWEILDGSYVGGGRAEGQPEFAHLVDGQYHVRWYATRGRVKHVELARGTILVDRAGPYASASTPT